MLVNNNKVIFEWVIEVNKRKEAVLDSLFQYQEELTRIY